MTKKQKAIRIVLILLLPFILVTALYLADFKCPYLHLKFFKNLFSWDPYDVDPVWMPVAGPILNPGCGLPFTITVMRYNGYFYDSYYYNYGVFAVNLLVWLALFVVVWVLLFRKLGRK